MSGRQCLFCGRQLKSSSGYTKHRGKCKARLQQIPKTIINNHIPTAERLPYSSPSSLDDSFPPSLEIHATSMEPESDDAAVNNAYDILRIGEKPMGDALEHNQEHTTSSATYLEHFNDSQPGSNAGMPVSEHCSTRFEMSNEDNEYYPYMNEADFAASAWFYTRELSKSDVTNFFEQRALDRWHSTLSFGNSSEWLDSLHRIPYGIQDDEWNTAKIAIPRDVNDSGLTEYTFYYRNVMKAIEFLIRHEPFKDNLTYAPVRVYSSKDKARRMYNELHTGDWWWETQKQLPHGATIIPLLLGTDKTLLTMLHGDQSVWPIYLTIGNLDAATRRSQLKPSTVLLGFIPILEKKQGNFELKSAIWHGAMERLLLSVEQYSRDGIQLTCADGYIRECFPIIAGFMADYEEQTVITGIKCNQQCTICTIPPAQRQNLTAKVWELRTHGRTITQLEFQQKNKVHPGDDSWLHPVKNFAWNHYLVNIHQCMMVDILHQLLKGAVMDLVRWIKSLLIDISSTEAEAMRNLDRRFRVVPVFPGVKHFISFSNITQWSGDEQKAIVKQLIPVVAPLLGSHPALHYARAVVDFVLIAQYTTHDEETLKYMEHAIYRIDCFKWAFADYRPIDKKNGKPHFNIPKLHSITHYVDQIRLFGSAVGMDSAHFEAAHKYLVKVFFNRTNKRKDEFEQQILLHNTRLTNLLAMRDVLDYRASRSITQAEKDDRVKVTKPSEPLNLSKWHLNSMELSNLRELRLPKRHWRKTGMVALYLKVPDLIDALAAFVKECRKRIDCVSISDSELDRRDPDPPWVSPYYISIHPSITCWKREGKNPANTEELSSELIRCNPEWRGKLGNWRRDYVFVQEHEKSNNSRQKGPSVMEGKMVGQLQLIVTVIDTERKDERGNCLRYTGALVELLRFRNSGAVDHHHGMVEVETWHTSDARNPRNIGARRFYHMSTILRSAHVVPTGLRDGTYYINNYIDWDTYNTIYDPDFFGQGVRAACVYGKQVGY